ncbi:MAG TPA: UDP-N-acetylmuramoyl-tripeptide--D-alanyl-D-alanine ligase [Ligilactobacillus salivarius]|uniref:UDP-N-acetylmuramoyl-tripeptide--D-alanyl-D-alanine ligase n=1 Tax=Ligilactobacillus salivarius TaxID=1624 RepID=A0A921LML4_9LACO|nr:UDP-N-acetylmuramoyl-tripeptide--D-alanyl-D-alanine ligase [Ligilactobacillus salivarius]
MKMQLAEVARALNIEAKEEWEDISITSVCFDSRKIEPGALFIPLVAENDGHKYVEAAINGGAVATLWQEDHSENIPDSIAVLPVSDTLVALQQLGKHYLMKINPKVVAITGSNGKTTTKDMTAAVLATQFNVHKTFANFNNEIGVPMTILSMEPNTEVLVVEMGMDRYGQLDFLSKLAEPDVAVITMIGEAHIEFFGTRDHIADAKMEITHGLKEDGELVINGDEPLLTTKAKEVSQEVLTFGSLDNNDMRAMDIVSDATKTSFKVATWPEVDFTINMIGAYNVFNALAALSVGNIYHIPVDKMQKALASFDLTANRTEWLEAKNGAKILSDVYNSNPTAVKEVLYAFEQVPTEGKRIIVLGDMLELGEKAAEMHSDLAQAINPDRIDSVYLCGELMGYLAEKLREKFDATQIHHYQKDDLLTLTSDLKNELMPDDIVLLKASHGIHLENVVSELI